MTYSKNRAGISILETIMVLVIAGLIIGAIWVSYGQVSLNDKAGRTVAGIYKTLENTRDFLQTQSTVPDNIGVQLLNSNNVYPADFIIINAGSGTTPPTLAPPMGATFTVTVNKVVTPYTRFNFNIALNNATECKKLGVALFSNQRTIKEKGYATYTVGITPATTDTNNDLKAMTAAEITTYCVSPFNIVATFYMRS